MSDLDIVDIHTHLWPPAWAPNGPRFRNAHALSPDVLARITSPAALEDALRANGIAQAVVTATVETLYGAVGPVDADGLREANDWLANLPARFPKLIAFGTVDPFAGDAGAREAERALGELNLSGLVLDSARDGRFVGDPLTRPTLEVAARYKVPVFIHPVAHPNADLLIAGAGALGNSLGRGLMNGIAFLSVIQSGLLDDLPDLTLVFATLGLGAIVQAARGPRYHRLERAAARRPNIYFDTMGHDPAIIRALTGFFGPERVLAGTDWPILNALERDSFAESLTDAGLDDAASRLVAGGNARRLLSGRGRR